MSFIVWPKNKPSVERSIVGIRMERSLQCLNINNAGLIYNVYSRHRLLLVIVRYISTLTRIPKYQKVDDVSCKLGTESAG